MTKKSSFILLGLLVCGTIPNAFGWELSYKDYSKQFWVGEVLEPPPYAAGVKSYFFHDPNLDFDPWGKKYKSNLSKNLIQKIEEAGDVRTVHVNIYYPTEKQNVYSQKINMLPHPLFKAKTGVRAKNIDFYEGNHKLKNRIDKEMGGPLFFIKRKTIKRQSYKNADIVDGKFPIVFMLHGLSGGHTTFNRSAEFMASHGFIAVTLSYISDSASIPIFEDPLSRYAKTKSKSDLLDDYAIIQSGNSAVFRGFFKFLYGIDLDPSSIDDFPNPTELKAIKGGGIKAGKMMAELFEQRIEDLNIVVKKMISLNNDNPFFKGKMDIQNMGVMGQSLGSITAQGALVHIKQLKTAIAFNNGLPRSWEPYGGFKNGKGVPKDILFFVGSDDNFVHMVFKEMFFKWFKNGGGDIRETMPLKDEQVWPTYRNPQPVARSAYNRATARKMFMVLRDQGHDALTDDVTWNPGDKLMGKRIPFRQGDNSFETSDFRVLGWIKNKKVQAYLPHQIRNYFTKVWFEWQLKNEVSKKELLLDHPFKESVIKELSEGIAIE